MLKDVVLLPPTGFADASARRAASKWGGKSQPRFSARRRIPVAARGLK